MLTSMQFAPFIVRLGTTNSASEAVNPSCSASTTIAGQLGFVGNVTAPAWASPADPKMPSYSDSKGMLFTFLKQFATAFRGAGTPLDDESSSNSSSSFRSMSISSFSSISSISSFSSYSTSSGYASHSSSSSSISSISSSSSSSSSGSSGSSSSSGYSSSSVIDVVGGY